MSNPQSVQKEYNSPFAMVDALVEKGKMEQEAARLLVEMFTGEQSPQLRRLLDHVEHELTRKDLVTKQDLKDALDAAVAKIEASQQVTNEDMAALKLDVAYLKGRLEDMPTKDWVTKQAIWVIGAMVTIQAAFAFGPAIIEKLLQ